MSARIIVSLGVAVLSLVLVCTLTLDDALGFDLAAAFTGLAIAAALAAAIRRRNIHHKKPPSLGHYGRG